jgi:excisionase family DNA binding protein
MDQDLETNDWVPEGIAELFEPLLSHKEAAALLRMSRETLRSMAACGEVPALKVGRFWKYWFLC